MTNYKEKLLFLPLFDMNDFNNHHVNDKTDLIYRNHNI